MNTLRIKLPAIALIGGLIALGVMHSNKTVAQTASNPYTGVCVGVMNLGNGYQVARAQTMGSLLNNHHSVNASFSIDFSTMKANILVNNINLPAASAGGPDTYQLKSVKNKTVTLTTTATIDSAAGTAIPISDAKRATMDTEAEFGEETEMLLIPVNSGNTFLIQGISFAASGVCQKV